MSVTIPLLPQGNGANSGWSSVVGATFAWQAVDDSDGATHDSADTYLVLPRLLPSLGLGTVSFPMFRQCEGVAVQSITVRVAARQTQALHPSIQIGFCRGGSFGFSGTLFTTGASFSTTTRTFITDPITGLAWNPALLPATEVCIRSEDLVLGANDVTLLNGFITGFAPTTWERALPADDAMLM